MDYQNLTHPNMIAINSAFILCQVLLLFDSYVHQYTMVYQIDKTYYNLTNRTSTERENSASKLQLGLETIVLWFQIVEN